MKIVAADSKYFDGSPRAAFTCAQCGRMEQTPGDPKSNWRVLEADGVPYFFCPAEFPAGGAGQKPFAKAYDRALKTINELLVLQVDLNLLAALRRIELSPWPLSRAVAGEAIAELFPRPKIERMAKRALQAGLHVQPAEVDALIARVPACFLL